MGELHGIGAARTRGELSAQTRRSDSPIRQAREEGQSPIWVRLSPKDPRAQTRATEIEVLGAKKPKKNGPWLVKREPGPMIPRRTASAHRTPHTAHRTPHTAQRPTPNVLSHRTSALRGVKKRLRPPAKGPSRRSHRVPTNHHSRPHGCRQ